MSFRKDHFLTFERSDEVSKLEYLNKLSKTEVHSLFHELLQDGVHGFCFSLYEDGQGPGDIISDTQIRKRLNILKPHTNWVRTFSCTEGNELIPVIAKELGMNTIVGAWLSDDSEKNKEEMDGLIELSKNGYVDVAAVGNEVLYRKAMGEEELIGHIKDVQQQLDGIDIPVGYVDAYYEFVDRSALTDACDVILCNCYPYWEGTHFKDSFQHMRQMYYEAKQAANGKRVIITETGWPSKGESLGEAIPSPENALRYFMNTNLWAKDKNIEVQYFSSFDENWKKSAEGEVGAYWGIWDKDGKLKY